MSSDMRFTQAQKRDLLRMSGAAVVSTIFFGVPMFVGRPDATRVQTVAGHEHQAPLTAAPSQPATTEPQVVVVVSEAVAATTTPILETPRAAAPRAPATQPRQTVASATSERPRAHTASSSVRPLARRLGRLLAGTGRYEVKPFPTVSTSGS